MTTPDLVTPPAIRLRRAVTADCQMLWQWRNEPTAREASLSTESIPYEEHERWFSRKLAAASTRIFVVEDADGRGIGYVRFDVDGADAFISVCVDKAQRGKGYGTAMIELGVAEMVATGAARRIIAHVKRTNLASVFAFERARFTRQELRTLGGADAWEMVYPEPRAARPDGVSPRPPR